MKVKWNYVYYLFLLLIISAASLFAQSDSVLSKDSIDPVKPILWGYQSFNSEEITGAISTIQLGAFNQGLVSDPNLLIQGKLAGVQIYNRGGDPNQLSQIRIRGLSALSQRRPLIVVDGIPGASLQNVDPMDIASITALKDGSAQAIYGIRASHGVLVITTKNGEKAHHPLSISYTGQVATSFAHSGPKVLSTDAFKQAGGLDLGSSTNWLDEVKQVGISHIHGLAIQGNNGRTNYRMAGNYRSVEGVMKQSGFEQFNFRGHLSSQLLQDKLEFNFSVGFTDRTSQLGFQDAFRYAAAYNPTAPVFAEDAPFPYDTEIFGGFFETIGLFDAFNPKAIIDLNQRTGKLQALTTGALLKYNIHSDFSAYFRFAYQNQFSNERAFYSPQSYYRGGAYQLDPMRRGRADLHDREDSFALYEIFGSYNRTFGSAKLELILGHAYQDGDHLDQNLELSGFSNESLLSTRRIQDYKDWFDEALLVDTINNGWSDRLSAFFSQIQLNIGDTYFLNASLRSEGSSKLGANNKRGLFTGLGAAIDGSKLFRIPKVDLFKLSIAYGVTGAIPDEGGLSQEKKVLLTSTNGMVNPRILRVSNSNLKWEEKREWNIGLDFGSSNWIGRVHWYNRSGNDLIRQSNTNFGQIQYVNQYTLETNGLELEFDLKLLDQPNHDYTMGLLFSTYQSIYKNSGGNAELAIDPCCGTLDPLMPIQEGEKLGNIYGPVFIGVDQMGIPIFQDLNQDGNINTSPDQLFLPENDLTLLGNGLPDFELGWNHRFRLGNWQLIAFFRGAFGHSLVNKQRIFYEPGSMELNPNFTYNLVRTEGAVEELSVPHFSSLYVEKANFLKLDHIAISRAFSWGSDQQPKTLMLSLSVQGVLLFTDYTGVDPEPIFADPGLTDNGGEANLAHPNPFAPGIDRRNYYLPSQNVVFGLGLDF